MDNLEGLAEIKSIRLEIADIRSTLDSLYIDSGEVKSSSQEICEVLKEIKEQVQELNERFESVNSRTLVDKNDILELREFLRKIEQATSNSDSSFNATANGLAIMLIVIIVLLGVLVWSQF